MDNKDLINVHSYESLDGTPDWAAAGERLVTLGQSLGADDISGTVLGTAVEGLLDHEEINRSDDPDAELVRQSLSILQEDLSALRMFWSTPETAGEVNGLPAIEVSGGAVTARGPAYPTSADEYKSPYWCLARMRSLGITRAAGLKVASDVETVDSSALR